MQSITQLIDLLKQFQSLAFVFTTNLEPLIMADSVPDYLSHQINHVDFIRLINRCQKDLKDLNDYINVLHPSIKKGLKAILKKNPSKKDPVIPYADFKVDEMPVFHKCERHEQLSFEQLLAQAEQNGKPIQPIHKRTNCSFEGVCPHCGAPHTFIYLNNGKGQFKCKICNRTFTLKTTSSDQVGIYCPHCGRKLHEKHNRKGYIVYVCMNLTFLRFPLGLTAKCSQRLLQWGLVPVGGGTILLGPDPSAKPSPYFLLYSALNGSSQCSQHNHPPYLPNDPSADGLPLNGPTCCYSLRNNVQRRR